MLIPLQVPLMGSRIVFKIMDEDTVCDEVVGSICVEAKDYIDDEICNVPMEGAKMMPRLKDGEEPADGDKRGKSVDQLDYDLDDNIPEELNRKTAMGEVDYNVSRTVKNGRFFWKNVYGAPLDKTNKAAENMNENPELGSLWKGRILMQIFAVKTEKPVYKVQ